VYFGRAPRAGWPDIGRLVGAGHSKEAIREKTGCTVALSQIGLTIEPGEMFVVMGQSGSGKSTLLRLINRLVQATVGTVRVGDTDVSLLSEPELLEFRRRFTGMVFQHFGLLPHRTVADNVAFPLRVQGAAAKEAREKAGAWIERVGLGGYQTAMPSELSGGMQQRVGLARALITGAPILLMDEPLGALDPVTRQDLQKELKSLQRELGKTVVLITHDPLEAFALADRIAMLREGRLVQLATPEEMAKAPADDQVAAFVAASRRLP